MRTPSFLLILLLALVLGVSLTLEPPTTAAQSAFTIERVSVSSGGVQGNSNSISSSISADGRFVAFESIASNLVPGDTNNFCETDSVEPFDSDENCSDIFVRDLQTDQTERVSVDSNGTQGNAMSWGGSISADGRYVAFGSFATNLVAGDTNGFLDIFVHDRQTGQTTRVSVSSTSAQANAVSGGFAISADGRHVAFASDATNLVPGDTNGFTDIFVHDRQTGQTTRVSVSSTSAQANAVSGGSAISADGRHVAFTSNATNLVPGDTNGFWDIFVHDRQTGQTTRVSVSSAGAQADHHSFDPSISADGRYVTFDSAATNLVFGDTNWISDVFVHDRQSRQTSRVSVSSTGAEGDGHSFSPVISADGRQVAFVSEDTDLVPVDTNGVQDVFVHDLQTGLTVLVSLSSAGTQVDDRSYFNRISADGRHVAFTSDATNLVPGDTNGVSDVFVVSNPLLAPSAPPVAISHIEITQVIQDETNSVPLIAGKPTFVRVYVDCGPGCGIERGVTGVLKAYYGPTNEERTFDPINGPIAAYWPLNWGLQRGDLNRTLNFVLLGEWLSGVVRLRAEVRGASYEETRTFQPSKGLRIAWVGVPYGANGTLYYADDGSEARLGADYANRIYPVDSIDYFQQPARRLDVMQSPFICDNHSSCPAETEYLKALNVFREYTTKTGGWKNGGTPPDRLYGWVPDQAKVVDQKGRVLCGMADAKWYGGKGLVAVGLSTPTCGATTFAHEIGHVLDADGLRHAPGCDTEGSDGKYPYPDGRIGNWGLNVLEKQLYPPSTTFDILSYCSPKWISIYNYRKFLNGFASFASQAQSLQPSDVSPLASERQLLVSGVVQNPSSPSVTFDTFYPLTSATPADISTGTQYCLELHDSIEAILDSRCFDLSFANPESGEPIFTDSFVFVVPYPAGTRSLILTFHGTEIGRVVSSNNAPSVHLNNPNGGEIWSNSGNYQITWSAGDSDGDALRFVISYSPDAGITWMPIALNVTGNSLDVDSSDLPGSANALVKVEATDRMNAAEDISDAPFTVGAKGPKVTISAPGNNAKVELDAPLFLQGSAYDLEDGSLTDASLSWTSSRDGALGTGETILTSLSLGQHLIRLTATDSDGNVSIASITLTVQQTTPQPPSAAPVLLTPLNATFTSDTTPVFTWQAVARADAYRIQIDTLATFPTPDVTGDVGLLAFEAPVLAHGLYYWRVRGLSAVGDGPWSAPRSFTVDTVPPPMPVPLAPTEAALTDNDRIPFSWSPSTGASRYQLRLDTVNPPVAVVRDGAGTTHIPSAHLILGDYYWQVRALDLAGNASEWSPARSLTITSRLGAAPDRNYFTTGAPTLTWSRLSQAAAYEVQVDNDPVFAAPQVFSLVVDAPTLDVTVTPALPDGTYYWRVRARDGNGIWGPWSVVDSFVVDVP